MKNLVLIVFLSSLFSCNRIETGDTLSRSDIKHIEKLGLLDKGETIHRFYSEYKNNNAGNFFTDKRVAKYWIDSRDKEKDINVFAFYSDIQSIDTVYDAGDTYCPYMLITRKDGVQFKVSVNGKRDEITSFFEEAMGQWKSHVK